MKQKRLISICMALLMLLSVFTSTAMTSFAANAPITNKPITVKFVDGETGAPVTVDFSVANSILVNDHLFTVDGCDTYTWTPANNKRLLIGLRHTPSEYDYIKYNYYINYAKGYPEPDADEPSDMRFLDNGVVEILLYQKNSPDNIHLNIRSKASGRLRDDGESVFTSIYIQEPLFLSFFPEMNKSFHPAIQGDYQVNLYNFDLSDYLLEQDVSLHFDGENMTILPNNRYKDVRLNGRAVNIFMDMPNERDSSFLNVQYVDADTRQPIQTQWSMYADDRSVSQWEVHSERSSQKQFAPAYFLQKSTDMTYHMSLENIPDGYVWPENNTFSFQYGDGGATKTPGGDQMYQKANTQIDTANNTVTVALKKVPAAKNITVKFEDRATGAAISPDAVTVKPSNGNPLKNTFQNNGTISFVPSYFTTNKQAAAYDINVQTGGYEALNLSNAFTYFGSITSSIANDYISVNGNAITIKMDKTVPVDPEPEPAVNLLKNGDFEAVNIPNWYQRGSNPTVMQTNSQYRSGAYSIYMAYFKNEAFNNHIDQTCAVNQSGNYKFSAYIKTDAMLTGAGAMLTLEARDANGVLLSSSTSAVASNTNGGWQQLSMQMYAPPGTASIVAKIGGVYCTGGFYVDDAELLYQS